MPVPGPTNTRADCDDRARKCLDDCYAYAREKFKDPTLRGYCEGNCRGSIEAAREECYRKLPWELFFACEDPSNICKRIVST